MTSIAMATLTEGSLRRKSEAVQMTYTFTELNERGGGSSTLPILVIIAFFGLLAGCGVSHLLSLSRCQC